MSKHRDNFLESLLAWHGNWFEDEQSLQAGRMSTELYPYTHLFAPLQVNRLRLKNRLVMGPMGNVSMADETGRPGQKMIAYYAARARGGVGLITSGLVPVSFSVDPTFLETGGLVYLPRIDGSRSVLAGWRDLAGRIHAHGAHFFIQLTPGAGRVGSPECVLKRRRLPVSSSWLSNFYLPAVPCRPLRDGEVRRLARATGQAAADARACQIDGVYLHGHEGYLLEQFANRAYNRRPWGRYADWERFGLDLVREIRRRCGPDYPIMYRIDLSLALRACYGERMDQVRHLRRFRGERAVEQTLTHLRHLVQAGVDMFDVDLGCYENWWLPHPPGPMPPGCYLEVARLAKEHLAQHEVRSNAGLPVPVVAVGKLGYPDLAERALREGYCDAIMLARPLLADPDWPRKAYAGRVQEIRPCIGDQQGCINEFVHGGHPQCTVNPRTGFEEQFPPEPPPASPQKRIAVVGAGPAGLLCACCAARRGHPVTLLEQRARVGGLLRPGAIPRIKFDLRNYLDYLEQHLQRHVREHGLVARFNTEATVELLQQGAFEAVVVCSGGRPTVPPVEGVGLPHVVQAVDLLGEPARAGPGRRVVVVGGGEVGCEVAHFLAGELGKTVTVIEMQPYLMPEVCTANRGYLIHYLEEKGVQLWNCARLQQVQEGQVVVRRNVSPTVPSPYVTWSPVLPQNIPNPLARPLRVQEETVTLEADLVVLATGIAPDHSLYEACVQARVAPEIHRLGDAFQPGSILEATRAAYALGRAL